MTPQSSAPLMTLLWMQWRCTRGMVLGVLPAMFAVCLALILADRMGLREEQVEIAAYSALFVSIGAVLITLLLIHSDAEKLHISIPLRTLRLPVYTWKLVLAFMGYGFIATMLLATGAALMVRYIIGLEFPWWLAPSVAVCALGAVQAWSYSMRDPNPWTASITFLVFLVPVIWFLRQDATFIFLTEVNPVVVLLGMPLALYAAGVGTLTLNRRGGLPAFLPERWTQGRLQKVDVQAMRPFKSPLRAQLWYEWRQFGWQLPLFIVIIISLYFLLMPLVVGVFGTTGVNHDWSGDAPPTSIYVDFLANAQFATNGLSVASIVAGVLVGAWMFMRAGYWNTKTEFLMSLPASTRKLAWARVFMTLQSTILGLVILGVLMALLNGAMILHGEHNRFIHYLEQGYLSTPAWQITAFFLGVLFITMWVAVWSVNVGMAGLVYLVVWGIPLGLFYLVRGAGLIEADASADALIQICLWMASGLLIGGLLCFAGLTLWNRLAGWGTALAAVAAYTVYATVFVIFVRAYEPYEFANVLGEPWPHPVNWPMWIGISVLPIAPLFVHPYFLERARHR